MLETTKRLPMNKVPRMLIAICLMVGLVATVGCEAITGGPTDSGNGGTPPTSSPTTIRVIANETLSVPFLEKQVYYIHLREPGILRWAIKETTDKYVSLILIERSQWELRQSDQSFSTIYWEDGIFEQSFEIPLAKGEYYFEIGAYLVPGAHDESKSEEDRIVSVYLEVES